MRRECLLMHSLGVRVPWFSMQRWAIDKGITRGCSVCARKLEILAGQERD
jgi:hypothetical protein